MASFQHKACWDILISDLDIFRRFYTLYCCFSVAVKQVLTYLFLSDKQIGGK